MQNNEEHREMPIEWATLREAGRYLRLSEPTVRRLLRDGKLPGARRIGSQWRVHLPTLREQLLQEIKKRRETEMKKTANCGGELSFFV